MRSLYSFALGLVALAFAGSAVLAAPSSRPTTPLGLDLYRPTPADNPLTPAKIALGRRLFNDRRLSRDGTVACVSCHDPERAFTDGRVVAVGIGRLAGRRNVPTVINRAYGASFFWDGRAASLEQQVVQPLLDSREMASTPVAVLTRVRGDSGYRRQFVTAFGRDPQWDDVARALASYIRTVRSGDSPYDRFQYGTTSALTDQEQRGMRLFLGRANCWSCHAGPNLTDERFHNTGIAWQPSGGPGPAGRYVDDGRFTVTGKDIDRGLFKTPTLREVARTSPYMHDGSKATLEEVVVFYNDGGRPNPNLDAEIRPLRLTVEERRALVAFLGSLSGQLREGR